METYGRAPKEISESQVCELHTEVCKDLNAMSGGKVLWSGKTRTKLVLLKHTLEECILGENPGHRAKELTRRYLSIMLTK